MHYIFDGAFGTYIFQKDSKFSIPELANITHPEVVEAIHKEYIDAGATAIRTNTFSVNTEHFTEEECRKLIHAGYQLGHKVALAKGATAFADIGPIDHERAAAEYVSIVKYFIEVGATHFIFETQNNAVVLEEAMQYIRAHCSGACIIVSFGVGQDGFSRSGEYIETLLDQAVRFGADCVGLNCVCGPTHILSVLKKLDVSKYNLTVMPNSSYQAAVSGRVSYAVANPEYFAQKMMEIHALGANVMGACCGSNPEYISALVKQLKHSQGATNSLSVKPVVAPVQKGQMADKFIAVEVDAPVDTNIEAILKSAEKIKASGADFITVPDSPLGRTRANSMMISSIIKRHVGIEVIPHLTCRDRNHIAIKGDLIAANIDNITNVLAITGDPIRFATETGEKSVFNLNSFKLISFINSLNEVVFANSPFNIAGALNITSKNFEKELARAEKKIENGVDCLFTQPIFSKEHLENYFLARKTLKCKIAVGIMPPVSYRNAVFLNNEVPSITIPDEVIEELKEADPAEVKSICLAYSKGIIDQIGEAYDGYYIMTQLNKVEFATELVEYIKSKNY